MNDNVEIIRSNKGGMKVIHRGYMYTVHKKRQGGGIRWRCTQRSLHCKGSISTGNGPPTVNMPHNHIPDPHSVALARCRQLEDFPDINSLLETEYDDIKESTAVQQRVPFASPPPLHIPSSASSESQLQSQPLSPTKLKVSRQITNKPKPIVSDEMEAPSDEVCLRWNSHHSNMQTAFPQLLQKEQYVDVTIIAEGRTLKCHRMILSSCSTYFEEILNDITPLQHPVIILKGIQFWILKALTDFMYAGEINIDQNKLPELLDVAELLKVKGLAGKNNNEEQRNEKNPNPPVKKPAVSSDEQQQQTMEKNQTVSPAPVMMKLENVPTADTHEVLESKFNDHSDGGFSKTKECKLLPKKTLTKKFRKRKSVECEAVASPPLFPMRRGTRSRPNVKIPKYYDYEDIVKPAFSDIVQPFSPVVNIKSEPIEVDDVYMQSSSEHLYTGTENLDVKHSLLSNIGLNPTPTVQNDSTKAASTTVQTSPYKIKIKCLASLSENTNCNEVANSPNDDIEKFAMSDHKVQNSVSATADSTPGEIIIDTDDDGIDQNQESPLNNTESGRLDGIEEQKGDPPEDTISTEANLGAL